jgi:hypothetical protein
MDGLRVVNCGFAALRLPRWSFWAWGRSAATTHTRAARDSLACCGLCARHEARNKGAHGPKAKWKLMIRGEGWIVLS